VWILLTLWCFVGVGGKQTRDAEQASTTATDPVVPIQFVRIPAIPSIDVTDLLVFAGIASKRNFDVKQGCY
jgi:hypothetical protein